MPSCLLWNNSTDSGCLDFDSAQTVGRLCFASGAEWIPRRLFELSRTTGIWRITLLSGCPDWIEVHVYSQNRWVVLTQLNPSISATDQAMIRFSFGDQVVKMLFLATGTCNSATHPTYLWRSTVWRLPNVSGDFDDEVTGDLSVKPAEDSGSISSVDREWSKRLTWLARYFRQYEWAGVAAIFAVVVLLFSVSSFGRTHPHPSPSLTPINVQQPLR